MDFGKRISIEAVEEGNEFAPKFDERGLIPVITMEEGSNLVLMHGYLNKEALKLSIETKQAHYWSRSREQLWKKGETSGLYQNIREILVDDDQDCVIFKVDVEGSGASCHVGYKSCFYRSVENIKDLNFIEDEKLFDPEEVYKGQENPTKL